MYNAAGVILDECYFIFTVIFLKLLQMLSGFKNNLIVHIRKLFLELTSGSEVMTKDVFMNIEGLKYNPLLDRVCLCFELEEDGATLDFQKFLVGIAAFNSPGLRQQKLKLAFRIQDFDGDNFISKRDMAEYTRRVSADTLTDAEINEVVNEVFKESCTDPKEELMSFADFQRIVAPLDFQAKLALPIP